MPELNVIVFQTDKVWGAQCLQHDIGAQGKTLQDVMYEMQRAIVGHIVVATQLDRVPFADLPAAPRDYWDMWRTAIKVEAEDEPFAMPVQVSRPRPAYRVAA